MRHARDKSGESRECEVTNSRHLCPRIFGLVLQTSSDWWFQKRYEQQEQHARRTMPSASPGGHKAIHFVLTPSDCLIRPLRMAKMWRAARKTRSADEFASGPLPLCSPACFQAPSN
jgi:hypothetical protein